MSTPLHVATPVQQSVIDRLKDVVGAGGYLEGAKDTEPYCVGWRDDFDGKTPLVLRPKETAEVAAILRICNETGTPVVPQGGITGLTGASQPHADMSEVVISTARMNKVRELDLQNDTITVDAGLVLAELQRIAKENQRLFPLSLGAEGSCQIGGNISTNAGGTQVLRYGNTRSLVLGLEVVLPSGEVWDGLRGLRKDNTGYDLKHLFIGAEGTLGLITAAVLRLFPDPTAVETAWLGLKSPADAVKLLGHMKAHLGDQISGFELMQRSIIDFLISGVPNHEDPLADIHPWYVLCEVSGQGAPGSLSEPFTATLAAAMEQGLVVDAVVAASGAQSAHFWKMREDMAEAQKHAGVGIKHDVSVPLSKIPEFIATTDAALEQAYPGLRLCAFGHVGDGNMHYNPVAPINWSNGHFADQREAINRIVHDNVIALGGSISAEHGIGRLRLDENMHYKSAVDIEMMRTIKRSFDPNNIMNPGKVIRL